MLDIVETYRGTAKTIELPEGDSLRAYSIGEGPRAKWELHHIAKAVPGREAHTCLLDTGIKASEIDGKMIFLGYSLLAILKNRQSETID